MTFAVGEIATLCNITTSVGRYLNGIDVTIMSPRGARVSPVHYEIDAPELRMRWPLGDWFAIEERYLRKRQPPPDWNALAGVRTLEVA